MGAVRQIIMSVVCLALISGIILTAAPDGSCKKYLSLIISLITTLILLSPLRLISTSQALLPRFCDIADDTRQYEEIRDAELISAAQELVSDAFRGCIAEKFSIPAENISAEVICALNGEGETNVTSAIICVGGVADEGVRTLIAEYTASLAECKPEVIFK